MSKATEYANRARRADQVSTAAYGSLQAVNADAPKFQCERTWESGSKTTVTACVQHDGSLELNGWLPADKVADFVKWLGEIYGD